MTKFVLVEDHNVRSIWNNLVVLQAQRLPTKPLNWYGPEDKRRPGDWLLDCAPYNTTPAKTYAELGITKPAHSQLPAIYCCLDDGTVKSAFNITPEVAVGFVITWY